MCEFCVQHGEGEKWYLAAKNYSEDLLSDLKAQKFFAGAAGKLADIPNQLESFSRLPGFVKRAVSWGVTRKMKKLHFGQVVPIEDIDRILGFTNSVVRIACICRYAAGQRDARFCYGVSMAANTGVMGTLIAGWYDDFLKGPDVPSAEQLTRQEALGFMHDNEREGMCHTVWTFNTPFIGAICNCDQTDCLAMRATVGHGVRLLFRAEYVAETNPDLCVGCRACMRICQFGAKHFSLGRRKMEIDPHKCYGCGSCRSVCTKDAIIMRDRHAVAAAKALW